MHRTRVMASAEHIDVEIRLTFYEAPSRAERDRMDADRDGMISATECEAYVNANEEAWRSSLGLRVDGEVVDPITLYAPRVDLLAREEVNTGRHELTLSYFVKTPPQPPDTFTVEISDHLWSDTSRIPDLTVSSSEGLRAFRDGGHGWEDQVTSPGDPLRTRVIISRIEEGPQITTSVEKASPVQAQGKPGTARSDGSRKGSWFYWLALVMIAALAVFAGVSSRISTHGKE